MPLSLSSDCRELALAGAGLNALLTAMYVIVGPLWPGAVTATLTIFLLWVWARGRRADV